MKNKDSKLSLLQYWNKHKFALADELNWKCDGAVNGLCPDANGDKCWKHCSQCAKRCKYCKTLHNYTGFIKKIDKYVKGIHMWDLTLDDIKFAMSKIETNRKTKYSEASLETAYAVLNDIFAYAAARCDAYNIMKGLRAGRAKNHNRLLNILTKHGDKPALVREEISKELHKHGHKPRSLTIGQIEKLSRILWNKITEDGRICLIALMLYTGIRPAEARALFWGDIAPLYDHPEVKEILIYKIRDKYGNIHKYPKTDNAFRRIPIHPELAALLKKRLAYIKKEQPNLSAKTLNKLPICCLQNRFSDSCKDFQVALKADEIFAEINISKKAMYVYALECELEKLDGGEKDDTCQHLTLYVLRRNFWTWLEALSTLTDMEKRYIMGHEMIVDKHSIRSSYNDENHRYEIYLKMSACIISFERHSELMTLRADGSDPIYVQNAGVRKIVVPKDLLRTGGTLIINAVTVEPGDAILLSSKQAFSIKPPEVDDISVLPAPLRVNCELEEWIAHRRHHGQLSPAGQP